MTSTLIKNQKKVLNFPDILIEGSRVDLEVVLSYDDALGKGHNTFSMSGTAWKFGKDRENKDLIFFGAINHIIADIPELASLAKWHLMNSSAPLLYITNTLYWVNKPEPNLEKGRISAIAPDATLEQLRSVDWLKNRLPALREEFRKEMMNLGFTYWV